MTPKSRAVHFSTLQRLMRPAASSDGESVQHVLDEASPEPTFESSESEPVPAESGDAPAGYSMRVRRNSVEFEVKGDKHFVLTEGKRLFDALIATAGSAPSASGLGAGDEGLRDAMLQFLANIAASGHPETILALACFLGERGHSPIGVADVEACYSLLGITPSANFNADFNSLVRRRLLIEAPRGHAGRKAWILTDGGLAAIHEKLRTS